MFDQFISEEIWVALNEDLEPQVGEIKLQSFKMTGGSPKIMNAVPQKSETYEFLTDFEVQFSGEIFMEIYTVLNIKNVTYYLGISYNCDLDIRAIISITKIPHNPSKN